MSQGRFGSGCSGISSGTVGQVYVRRLPQALARAPFAEQADSSMTDLCSCPWCAFRESRWSRLGTEGISYAKPKGFGGKGEPEAAQKGRHPPLKRFEGEESGDVGLQLILNDMQHCTRCNVSMSYRQLHCSYCRGWSKGECSGQRKGGRPKLRSQSKDKVNCRSESSKVAESQEKESVPPPVLRGPPATEGEGTTSKSHGISDCMDPTGRASGAKGATELLKCPQVPGRDKNADKYETNMDRNGGP